MAANVTRRCFFAPIGSTADRKRLAPGGKILFYRYPRGGCIPKPTKPGWDCRNKPSCIKEVPPYRVLRGSPWSAPTESEVRAASRTGRGSWRAPSTVTCLSDLLTEIEPYIRSIAIGYLSRFAEMEDAVQDVLMTVHSIRQTYDPNRPFGPWLVTIAHRRSSTGFAARRAGWRTLAATP